MTQLTGGLEHTSRCRFRRRTDIASGFCRGLKDATHRLRGHCCHVCPNLSDTGNRASDSLLGRCQDLASDVTHTRDETLRHILGTCNEPCAHLFGRLHGAFHHVTNHRHALTGYSCCGFHRIGQGMAHQANNLRLNLMETPHTADDAIFDCSTSVANALTYPCVGSHLFCHLPPPIAYSTALSHVGGSARLLTEPLARLGTPSTM